MVGVARREHRVRGRLLPRARGRRRDADGGARLRQRVLGDPRDGAGHRAGRLADRGLRGAPRARHGPADPRRRLRLPRLDDHVADLRQLHLHLLRARGRGDGLRARPRVRHPARMGLPGLRARRAAAGHARRHRDRPPAGLDAAAVDRDARAALRVRLLRASARARRPRGLPGRRRARRRVRPAEVRQRDDGGHRADDADGRAGRLPALHAGAHRVEPPALVGVRRDRRSGLGAAGRAEDAGWNAARVDRDRPLGAAGSRGRPEPDVPRRLRHGVQPPRAVGRGDGAVRDPVAAQDQRHQRLRRLARVVELLRAAHAQPPGARRVARVQHGDRADADGARRLHRAGQGARPVREPRDFMVDGGRRGSRRQQAARPLAQGHRVPPRLPVRREPGRRRRDGRGIGAGHRGASRCLRRLRAGLLGGHRGRDGLRRVAAHRVVDSGPLLPRPRGRGHPARARPLAAPAMQHLRARLRRRRHGALPGLPGPDLLAVLLARRALRRPVQARRAPGRAGARRDARVAAAPALARVRRRPGRLARADDPGVGAARHAVRAALPAGAARPRRRVHAGHRRAGRPRGCRAAPRRCASPASACSRCCCWPAASPAGGRC